MYTVILSNRLHVLTQTCSQLHSGIQLDVNIYSDKMCSILWPFKANETSKFREEDFLSILDIGGNA